MSDPSDRCAEPASAFVEALTSLEANPVIPADKRIFDPLMGSWDLLVRWFDRAGKVLREEPGEWHFAWVLEGRAVQDVWIVPPRSDRGSDKDYEYGTSLRFFDARTGDWQSTWIGPMHRVVRSFVARRVDGRIVLETLPGTGPNMRWTFSGISRLGFRWTNEVHEDGGWWTQQTFDARRRTVA